MSAMNFCKHVKYAKDVEPRTPQGCEECLKIGATWVHLRLCLECGHVGCCNDSTHKHAARHFVDTSHPIIQSFEPEDDWGYCYIDEKFIDNEYLPAAQHHPRQMEAGAVNPILLTVIAVIFALGWISGMPWYGAALFAGLAGGIAFLVSQCERGTPE